MLKLELFKSKTEANEGANYEYIINCQVSITVEKFCA